MGDKGKGKREEKKKEERAEEERSGEERRGEERRGEERREEGRSGRETAVTERSSGYLLMCSVTTGDMTGDEFTVLWAVSTLLTLMRTVSVAQQGTKSTQVCYR